MARLAVMVLALASSPVLAQSRASPLPDPLRPTIAARIAVRRRAEIVASERAIDAARERPRYVGALEDPEIVASVDHLPLELHGVDFSATVEQRFPLSRLRGRRERAALAALARTRAEVGVARSNVALEAELATLAVYEAREMRRVVEQQRELALQLVGAAEARYVAGLGGQAEVLRAETEVARVDGEIAAVAGEIVAMEAMLRAALALPPATRIPRIELALPDDSTPPPTTVRARAARRPEIGVARAMVREARAEIDVSRSMDAPMLMVRAGGAYTMSDGPGAMLMVGVSVPLWRGARRAQIAESRAMAARAEADLAAMLRMTEGQAGEARGRIVAARARLRALRENIAPLATRTVAASLAGYVSGQVELAGVLESLTMLWDVRERILTSEVAVAFAWARLRRTTGAFGVASRAAGVSRSRASGQARESR